MSDYTETYESGSSDRMLSAFFDNRADAENAMAQLRSLGISESDLRLTEGSGTQAAEGGIREEKGFFEKLGEVFMPDEDRHVYAEGLSRGGYLLTLTGLSFDQQETALDVLENAGAVDIDEKEASWRAEGWSGYSGGSQSQSYGDAVSAPETTDYVGEQGARGGEQVAWGGEQVAGDVESIPVIEERLRVGKRDVSHGRVRVRSYVRETPVSEQVDLSRENVVVERRAVDREVAPGDEVFRDRTIEAEEHAEEAIVAKEARIVEEITLRRERESHQETISDTVRSTEVEVEDDRVEGNLPRETDRR